MINPHVHMMNKRVAILGLSASKGARYGPSETHSIIAGLESVPCRFSEPHVDDRMKFAQAGTEITNVIAFAPALSYRLDSSNRIQFTDPRTPAKTRTFVVVGAIDDCEDEILTLVYVNEATK